MACGIRKNWRRQLRWWFLSCLVLLVNIRGRNSMEILEEFFFEVFCVHQCIFASNQIHWHYHEFYFCTKNTIREGMETTACIEKFFETFRFSWAVLYAYLRKCSVPGGIIGKPFCVVPLILVPISESHLDLSRPLKGYLLQIKIFTIFCWINSNLLDWPV